MAAGIGRGIISSQQGQAHGREFGGALGVEKDRQPHRETKREGGGGAKPLRIVLPG